MRRWTDGPADRADPPPTAGQAYYRRKRAEGKSPKEALRCRKRRPSDAVYRCLLADQTHHNGGTVQTG